MPRSRAPRLALACLALVLAACPGGRISGPIHASGHIEATEVRIAAKIGGRLAELPPTEGDAVKAGAIIARIDTIDLENDLARARADADAAEARLALLLAGTRTEDIARIEAELARAEADLAGAETDARRLEGLAERGTATLKARDDARTRVQMLQRGVAAWRAEVAKMKSGPRPQEIAQARAQKAAAEALVATIAQRIADCAVRSPRDGTITQRAAEPGEILPAGGLLLVLTDVASPWLEVWVDEPSLAAVHLGDAVTVRVDGRAGDLQGRVSYVSTVAEFTPKNVQTPEERAKLVFKVKISLANPDGVFKPGMPADAYFARADGAPARGARISHLQGPTATPTRCAARG